MKKILNKLDGLYAGIGNQFTHFYYFKPSNSVAIDYYETIVDPDVVPRWPQLAYGASQIGYTVSEGGLGTYELLGDEIRLTMTSVEIDPQRKIVLSKSGSHNEVKDFRWVQDDQKVKIGGIILIRQSDQTGRKLDGEFAHESFGITRRSRRMKFTAVGAFALDETTVVSPVIKGRFGPLPPGGKRGTGQYEIRGHEIFFKYADGSVDRKLFGYLGNENGKEQIAIGSLWLIKGLFG